MRLISNTKKNLEKARAIFVCHSKIATSSVEFGEFSLRNRFRNTLEYFLQSIEMNMTHVMFYLCFVHNRDIINLSAKVASNSHFGRSASAINTCHKCTKVIYSANFGLSDLQNVT